MSDTIRTVRAMTAVAVGLREARRLVPDLTTQEYINTVATLLLASEVRPEVVASALEAAAAEVRRGS